MTDLTFVSFEGKRAISGAPEISILKSGSIGFTTAFMNEFGLANSRYVAFRFAEDDNHYFIGFSFLKELEGNASKIYYPKRDYGMAAANAFLKNYKIGPSLYAGRYIAERRDDPTFGIMYVIKIPKIMR